MKVNLRRSYLSKFNILNTFEWHGLTEITVSRPEKTLPGINTPKYPLLSPKRFCQKGGS